MQTTKQNEIKHTLQVIGRILVELSSTQQQPPLRLQLSTGQPE
jgi:hypothetical protein